jgi:hypothetical protein
MLQLSRLAGLHLKAMGDGLRPKLRLTLLSWWRSTLAGRAV